MNHLSYKDVAFQRRIMRRVYAIWFTKRVLPTITLELGIVTLAAVAIQSYMSFGLVFATTLERAGHYSPGKFGSYVVEAFYRAEWITTLLFLIMLVVGSLFLRDSARVSKDFGKNFFWASRVS